MIPFKIFSVFKPNIYRKNLNCNNPFFNPHCQYCIHNIADSFFRNFQKMDQVAHVERTISRLVNRTALEIEGWKRIPAIRKLFKKAKLTVIFGFIKFMHFEAHPTYGLKLVPNFKDKI